MKTTEEIIKEWLKTAEEDGAYIRVDKVLSSTLIDGYVDLQVLASMFDQLWHAKIRSLIAQIHGGGNARRLLESLLSNPKE